MAAIDDSARHEKSFTCPLLPITLTSPSSDDLKQDKHALSFPSFGNFLHGKGPHSLDLGESPFGEDSPRHKHPIPQHVPFPRFLSSSEDLKQVKQHSFSFPSLLDSLPFLDDFLHPKQQQSLLRREFGVRHPVPPSPRLLSSDDADDEPLQKKHPFFSPFLNRVLDSLNDLQQPKQ